VDKLITDLLISRFEMRNPDDPDLKRSVVEYACGWLADC
jgi:hypothetical protein